MRINEGADTKHLEFNLIVSGVTRVKASFMKRVTLSVSCSLLSGCRREFGKKEAKSLATGDGVEHVFCPHLVDRTVMV